MRDAFLKKMTNPARDRYSLLLAEDITRKNKFSSFYDNILLFETDFAQLTELVLLFCESEGSFAELGAFAIIDEIAARLLVVIREKYWEIDSFITQGPSKPLKISLGKLLCLRLEMLTSALLTTVFLQYRKMSCAMFCNSQLLLALNKLAIPRRTIRLAQGTISN